MGTIKLVENQVRNKEKYPVTTPWGMEATANGIRSMSIKDKLGTTTKSNSCKVFNYAKKDLTDTAQITSNTSADPSCRVNQAVVWDDKGCVSIDVHPNTVNPHSVWVSELKREIGNVRPVMPEDLKLEDSDNHIRFVCISDTHSRVERGDYIDCIPAGDVLLHAGDFTLGGSYEEFEEFNQFLGQLPHKIKLVIPGNHETTLDRRTCCFNQSLLRRRLGLQTESNRDSSSEIVEALKNVVSNAKILIDSQVEICGIKIYGTPWIPLYGSDGFGLHRGIKLLQKYNQIPAGIDILMSHGPPVGFGDRTFHRKHVGCVELLNSVRHRIKPRYLVCGHVHEGYGVLTDGATTYINAAVCNKMYRPVHLPIVFDVPLPSPYTRDDLLKLQLKDLS